MEFNQLITKTQSEVTEGQRAFLNTHNAILRAGSIMKDSVITLSLELKTMRDSELYTEAGFESFEDYTENAVGIKRRQAYNYIKVLETLGEDFVQSTAQIGITKLELLARIGDDTREQIQAQGNVADITVKELEQRIKDLEQEKKELKGEYDAAQETIEDLREDYNKANDELEQAKSELENVQSTAQSDESITELNEQITKLQKEIKALKAKPAEKEVVEKVVKDEKTAAELAAAKKEIAAHADLIKAKEAELAKARKQLENAGDQKLLKFKIKFEELRALLGDVMACWGELSADKQPGCKEALKALIGGVAI